MATQSVKAWTCAGGYPQGLDLTSIDVPQAGEVENGQTSPHILVKINAAAINPVDIQAMNVRTWNTFLTGQTTRANTGRDFSGTIVDNARMGFVRGDSVMGLTFTAGALAEVGHFDSAATAVVKKPPQWSHEQAAAIPLVWLTARTCIEEVAEYVEKSESKKLVVLGGSSSTGIYTTIIAKRRGWKVLATSSGKNKDFLLSKLGVDQHVDYTSEDVRKSVIDFKPVAIVDCVGGTECIGVPGNKRYITIVGDKTSRTTMGGPFTYYDYTHPIRMATQWARWASGQIGLTESYDVVILKLRKDWLEEATATLTPDEIFIDSTFAFADAKKAFERLDTGRAKGKIVITVSA